MECKKRAIKESHFPHEEIFAQGSGIRVGLILGLCEKENDLFKCPSAMRECIFYIAT